ncbi:hypothetical protein MHU86_6104 [Fragilaria crotonensis]|nr:hypothetical protein MHU86_6104 [Fragilaria crotonensis]
MKLKMTSRSRAIPDDEAMSSPMKKQRTCGTPLASPPLMSDGIFRPRRSKVFDDETEDLLKIRRGVVLQPILTDLEDSLLERDKENYPLLPKVLHDDQYISMFPSVVVDSTAGTNGVNVSKRDQSA